MKTILTTTLALGVLFTFSATNSANATCGYYPTVAPSYGYQGYYNSCCCNTYGYNPYSNESVVTRFFRGVFGAY